MTQSGHIKKFYTLFKIIGIIIFFYILSKQDLKTIKEIFSKTDYFIVFLSILLFPVMIFLKTLRIKSVLSCYTNEKLDSKIIYKSYMESYFWGTITPGKVGEFSRFFYINSVIKSKILSLFLVLIDRFIDLFLIIITGMISFFYLLFYTGKIGFYRFSMLCAVCVVIFVLINYLLLNKKLYILLSGILKKFFTNFSLLNELPDYAKNGLTGMIAKWNFITIVSWAIYFFQIFLLAAALKINLSYGIIVVIISLSSLIALVPVSISGLGTRDAVIIYILSKIFNFPTEQGFSLAVLVFFIMYIEVIMGYVGVNVIFKTNND
ncbi:flippase-like domain-containing protein [Candidatus Dependentiae bacterium]|nr:flippase-like domain-containing protein [Candidatus Dependentiae bacterium]